MHSATPLAIGIIPARLASTRLPRKALVEIAGKPMIQHVYDRACQAESLDSVLVATDSREIFSVVQGFGGEAVMTRDDHPSGSDRLAEVARGLNSEIIVNIQGDEPLVAPEMIDSLVRAFQVQSQAPMGTLVRRAGPEDDLSDPSLVKVVVDRRGHALYFSRCPIPHDRDGDGHVPALTHVGMYAYRRTFLLAFAELPATPLEGCERLEQLRALEHGHAILTVETEHAAIGVDTPEDLARVRRILEG